MDDDDDDDDSFGGLYDDGHWEWSKAQGALVFISDLPPVPEYLQQQTPIIIGSLDFRDDLDIMEQDVKDLVLFTAPKNVLTTSIVNVLHLPMTERFMRALIAYCQYYLQVLDTMHTRMAELSAKMRTFKSEEVESTYLENLNDFRLLIAKEYCGMVMGAGDFIKYHHMGNRRTGSLSKKESVLFESLLRICTQIVWLALGRKCYKQIEVEIHRVFKSDLYNIVEHKLDITEREELEPLEQSVIFGDCVRQGRMCNSHSPLWSEINCHGNIDYQLMGLGVIKYHHLTPRMRYFEQILIAPEHMLKENGVVMGILGLPRKQFDIMLRDIKYPVTTSTSTQSVKHIQSKSITSRSPKSSRPSTASKKSLLASVTVYENIIIPDIEESTSSVPEFFPETDQQRNACSDKQRKKWINHVRRLVGKRRSVRLKRKIMH